MVPKLDSQRAITGSGKICTEMTLTVMSTSCRAIQQSGLAIVFPVTLEATGDDRPSSRLLYFRRARLLTINQTNERGFVLPRVFGHEARNSRYFQGTCKSLRRGLELEVDLKYRHHHRFNHRLFLLPEGKQAVHERCRAVKVT